MIQANELRIGNYVKTDSNKTLRISSSGISGIEQGLLKFSPIPLTPEILEKCGFKSKKLPTNFDNGRDGMQIILKESAKRYLLITGANSFFMTGVYDSNNIYNLQPTGIISSLHQLQNLYYALTGEEPNFKP